MSRKIQFRRGSPILITENRRQAESVEREIELRRAREKDLPEIQLIEKVSFINPYSTFYQKHLLKHADIYYVALYRGKIIGYIIARVENRGLPGVDVGKIGHIVSIAIHPDYRRRGLGRLLMIKAEEELKRMGCKRVYLEVRVTNYPAIKLYHKLGYVKLKVIPRYYQDGEDAYLMLKSLI